MNPDTHTPERQRTIREIFLDALDVPRARRALFVAERCGADEDLRRRVLEMFLLHGEEDSVLDHAPDPTAALQELGERLGRQFGRWRPERELGRGGMGVVYLARDAHGARVALKLLAPGVWTAEVRERFRLEADILRRLSHPGIARLFDMGESEDGTGAAQPWIALEFVEGTPLLEFMSARALPESARLRLLAAVCDAVQHAHAHGVVHRDLKPSNILVRGDGRPMVLDFGVARVMSGDERPTELATRTGQLVGTPQYMSPEQVQAEPSGIGPASDVYSLGVIAYEMLAGRRPYDATSVSLHRAVVSILTVEPPPLGKVAPHLRGAIERVVTKALEKNPADRYANAGEFADDLRRWLDGRTVRARGPSLGRRVRRWSRGRRRAVAASAGVVLLALIAVPWWFATHHGPTREAVQAAYADAERLLTSAVPVLYEQERTPDSMRRAIALYEQARARLEGMPRLRHRGLLDRSLGNDLGTAQMLLGELTFDPGPLRMASRTLTAAVLEPPDTSAGWMDDSPVMKTALLGTYQDGLLSLLSRSELSLYRVWGQHSPMASAVAAHTAALEALRERIGPPLPARELDEERNAEDRWAFAYNGEAELYTVYAEFGHSVARAGRALAASDSALARRAAFAHDVPALGSLFHVRGNAYRVRGELTASASDLDSALYWLRSCRDYRLASRPFVHAETRESFARAYLAEARLAERSTSRVRLLERAFHEADTARALLRSVAHPAALASLESLAAEIVVEQARAEHRSALLDSAGRMLDRSALVLRTPDLPHHAGIDAVRRARLAAARVELGVPGARIETALEILDRARLGVAAERDSLVIHLAREYTREIETRARPAPGRRRP